MFASEEIAGLPVCLRGTQGNFFRLSRSLEQTCRLTAASKRKFQYGFRMSKIQIKESYCFLLDALHIPFLGSFHFSVHARPDLPGCVALW
jgi:hypothetical protein